MGSTSDVDLARIEHGAYWLEGTAVLYFGPLGGALTTQRSRHRFALDYAPVAARVQDLTHHERGAQSGL
jgi:hypothetical protein